ncbi:MAG: hypothetical protein JST88_09400 [Bacteroidetes bacterium]|nr:hypothetical protein [Bacteroidota bacterium]
MRYKGYGGNKNNQQKYITIRAATVRRHCGSVDSQRDCMDSGRHPGIYQGRRHLRSEGGEWHQLHAATQDDGGAGGGYREGRYFISCANAGRSRQVGAGVVIDN